MEAYHENTGRNTCMLPGKLFIPIAGQHWLSNRVAIA